MKTLDLNIRLQDLIPNDTYAGDFNGQPVDSKGLVAAAGSVTIATNPTDADTLVVDGKTYTFQDSLTNVDGHIKIAVSAALTQANLKAAMNLDGGTPGTDYAAATTRHKTVTASTAVANVVALTARASGVAGNSITLTETMAGTGNVVSGATLSGGRDGAQFDAALVRVAIGDITGTPDSLTVAIYESETADFASSSLALGGDAQTVVAQGSYTFEIERRKKFIRAVVDFTAGTTPGAGIYAVALLHNYAKPLPIQV